MEPIPVTIAGRMQVISELLAPPIWDEADQCIVGYGEPLITAKEAMDLLEIATQTEKK